MPDVFVSHAPQEVYDAFLSYNHDDRAAVEELAHRLADHGLRIFFDAWTMVPGGAAQDGLEQGLRKSRSCVVFLGPSGSGPWQTAEIRVAVEASIADPGFRVIPVLLEGYSESTTGAPTGFLAVPSRIDMRDEDRFDASFAGLCAGILGRAPGRPSRVPSWLRTVDVPGLEHPTGLAYEGGALYVADHDNGRLLKFEDGRHVDVFEGLSRPHHVAALYGQVVVCDTYNDRLICLDEHLQELWTCRCAGPKPLRRPHGVCWEAADRLLLANTERHEVARLRVTRAGKVIAPRPKGEQPSLTQPCGIGVRPDAVLVANTFAHQICVLDVSLKPVLTFGCLSHTAEGFAYPVGLACWQDWVVIADEYNQRLQLWRLSHVERRWAADCVSSDLCGEWLGSPFGVAFTPFDGDLWVSDRKRGKVLHLAFRDMLDDLAVEAPPRPALPTA